MTGNDSPIDRTQWACPYCDKPNRCKHDVWLADGCYFCEEDKAQQSNGWDKNKEHYLEWNARQTEQPIDTNTPVCKHPRTECIQTDQPIGCLSSTHVKSPCLSKSAENEKQTEQPDERTILADMDAIIWKMDDEKWGNIHQMQMLRDKLVNFLSVPKRESSERISVCQITKIKEALSNCEPEESGWLAENYYAEEGCDEDHTALLKSKWAARDKSQKQIENALRIINDLDEQSRRGSGNDVELITLKAKIAARAWQILDAHQDDRAMLAHTMSKEILTLCDQPDALERLKEIRAKGSE